MSTPTVFNPDPYGAYERAYNVEMLQTQVFGSFFAAWEFRKTNVGMTNVEIARRSGWTRSQISKLMNAPQNWTLKTISELATALDVDFKFVLVDKTSKIRCFDAGGVSFNLGQDTNQVDDMYAAMDQGALFPPKVAKSPVQNHKLMPIPGNFTIDESFVANVPSPVMSEVQK